MSAITPLHALSPSRPAPRVPLGRDGRFEKVARWVVRRVYGKVLDPLEASFHHRPALASMLALEATASFWKKLPPTLHALAVMAPAREIGCSWCMDFGYWEYHHRGVDPHKLRDIGAWRTSSVYSPLERAVLEYAFVLHEVFAAPYAEIAETLERSEAAVRQLVRRARAHVRERTPRHPVDESTHRALTEAFLEAVRGTAALEDMISVLSPDVVLTTDGGGHAKAARRPVRGTDNVLRFAAGVLAKPEVVILSWQVADINGRPALVGHDGPRVDCVVWVEGETAGAETVVTRIDMIRNPGKLRAVRV